MSEMEEEREADVPAGDVDVRHTGSFGKAPDDDAIASIPTLN